MYVLYTIQYLQASMAGAELGLGYIIPYPYHSYLGAWHPREEKRREVSSPLGVGITKFIRADDHIVPKQTGSSVVVVN